MLARLLRRACLASLLLVLAGCSSSSSPAPDPTPAPPVASTEPDAGPAPEAPNALATSADALFTEAESKKTFAGTVVVVDGGKIVLEKAYGTAHVAPDAKNAADTIFRIGSVTKQFTATAVLTLAAEGKLAVTDPLSKHFPDYPTEKLTKDGAEVTLHHLLSHTSGLADPRQSDYFKTNVWKKPIDRQEMLRQGMLLDLIDKPGASFKYLNQNFLLLALVIEKVSGQSWEELLTKRFFEPLGMKDTGAFLPASKKARAATGYYEDTGTLMAWSEAKGFGDPDVTFAFGSGQLYSTAHDLALWDRALASGKIAPAIQKQLFTANVSRYGYGWSIEKESGVDIQWHNGAISPLGFSSFVVRVPSKDRFIAYLANRDIDITEALEGKVAALSVK
jgi:D-alanyl-D-alanine carboxypeptidase